MDADDLYRNQQRLGFWPWISPPVSDTTMQNFLVVAAGPSNSLRVWPGSVEHTNSGFRELGKGPGPKGAGVKSCTVSMPCFGGDRRRLIICVLSLGCYRFRTSPKLFVAIAPFGMNKASNSVCYALASFIYGMAERGIRTLRLSFPNTRFQACSSNPLGHLSARRPGIESSRKRTRRCVRLAPKLQLTRQGQKIIPTDRLRRVCEPKSYWVLLRRRKYSANASW